MKSKQLFMLSTGLLVVLAVVSAIFSNSIKLQDPASVETFKGNGFAVVELFTSEGCSSCPAADELVEQFQHDIKSKDLYVLSYHVDYWDHQGWKDKFSDAKNTERQRRYLDWMQLQTIYTPQIFVNGTTEYVGSDEKSILDAILTSFDHQPKATLKLTCHVSGNLVNISYENSSHDSNTELVLALIQKKSGSSVTKGENAGRKLSHVQIVRNVTHVQLDSSSVNKSVIVVPTDLMNVEWEVIGFIQDLTNGHILAADRYSNFQSQADLN